MVFGFFVQPYMWTKLTLNMPGKGNIANVIYRGTSYLKTFFAELVEEIKIKTQDFVLKCAIDFILNF